jgi:hypothetical protein
MPSLDLNSKDRQHENNDSDDPNNTSEWIVVKKKHKKKTFESAVVLQSHEECVIIPRNQNESIIIPQSQDASIMKIVGNKMKIVGNKLVLICSLSIRDDSKNGRHLKDSYFMKNYESLLEGKLKIILYGYRDEDGYKYIISDNICVQIMKKNEDSFGKYLRSRYFDNNSKYFKFECSINEYYYSQLSPLIDTGFYDIFGGLGMNGEIGNDTIIMQIIDSNDSKAVDTFLSEDLRLGYSNTFYFHGISDSIHAFGRNYGFDEYYIDMKLIKKIVNNEYLMDEIYVIIASFYFHEFFDATNILTMFGNSSERQFLFILKN